MASTDRPGLVLTVICTMPSSTLDIRSMFSREAMRSARTKNSTLVPNTSFVLGIMDGMWLRYQLCMDFTIPFTGAWSFSFGCHW